MTSSEKQIMLAVLTITVLASLVNIASLFNLTDQKCVTEGESASGPESKLGVDSDDWLPTISTSYKAADSESYLAANYEALGLNTTHGKYAKGCSIYKEEIFEKHALQSEAALKMFNKAQTEFQLDANIKDIRHALGWGMVEEKEAIKICKGLDILRHDSNPTLVDFSTEVLSFAPNSGFMEALLPPLRSFKLCSRKIDMPSILSMDYLVHDFAMICQEKFAKPMLRQIQAQKLAKSASNHTIRTIFMDLGASLDFHSSTDSPAVYITALYERFGIPFDHVYAYEITEKNPNKVFSQIPKALRASYHWINVGISAELNTNEATNYKHHPWQFLEAHYTPGDFVVVKLDVDTPSVENPLVKQLLEHPTWHRLIDVFYFEHHVHLQEIAVQWGKNVEGSVADSVHLFKSLREKGIAAHSWV